MGVRDGWKLFRPDTTSFVDWSANKISSSSPNQLGPCLGVDASGWMFAAKYHHAQTKNPAQASLFKRLGCLFHLPILPLFIFDGPKRPLHKRKKQIRQTTDWLTADFKRLLDGFGFAYWDAPGEAEAELAMLSSVHKIDAVMSEDFDALLFGAQCMIQINDESDSQYLIEVYKNDNQFLPHDLVVIALLSGGDYDASATIDGIQGCGIQTDVEIAKTGIGKWLFDALKNCSTDNFCGVTSAWRKDLCDILEKGSYCLNSRHRSLVSHIPLDFPNAAVVSQYFRPLTSQSKGECRMPVTPLPSLPDIPKLAKLCEELFSWGNCQDIIRKFGDHVFPGLAVWELLLAWYKRRGVEPNIEKTFTPQAIINQACSLRSNQQRHSSSELYVSLTITPIIFHQIASSVAGSYNAATPEPMSKRWTAKAEIRVWLPRVLTLHALPSFLDNFQLQEKEGSKMMSSNVIVKSPRQNSGSKLSQNSLQKVRSTSVIEVSSDEESEMVTG
ncbi:PIN domain-like protein [Armillaria novae-zelandiae]|uniref:PIN domain-like protein n=1 Tax=Armillaria novae-zelandiae TaxID=153914 RepID=A0AA39PDW4_9AGAR|nr:PIN domain-like protein [Armillaria novae-zelandiae]